MGKVYQYKQEPDKPASFWTVEWNERVMLKSWYGYFTAIIDGQTNDSAGKQVEEI